MGSHRKHISMRIVISVILIFVCGVHFIFAEDGGSKYVTEEPLPWDKDIRTPEQLGWYRYKINSYAGATIDPKHNGKYIRYFEGKIPDFQNHPYFQRAPLYGDYVYENEFNLLDSNYDGIISESEWNEGVQRINDFFFSKIQVPDEHYETEYEPFFTVDTGVVNKIENGGYFLDMDMETFKKYHTISDLITGYALFRIHDNYKKKQNGYVCIAEYSGMHKYWTNLLGIYDGPYTKLQRRTDFVGARGGSKDGIWAMKGKMMIMESAVYKITKWSENIDTILGY